MKTIFLIEDNMNIKKGLDYLFYQNDFLLLYAKDLKEATLYITSKKFDLILLDVSLPDGNGFSFYKENKAIINVPVIFLTAKDMEDDIVKGLELGAVDYIIKPFRNRELLLRINNALKYSNYIGDMIKIKNICVYKDSMRVIKDGIEVPLTYLEYKIFYMLIENIGRVVMREAIIDKIWNNEEFINDNTLTVYIKRIRKKVGDNIIKTIKGIGYRVDR